MRHTQLTPEVQSSDMLDSSFGCAWANSMPSFSWFGTRPNGTLRNIELEHVAAMLGESRGTRMLPRDFVWELSFGIQLVGQCRHLRVFAIAQLTEQNTTDRMAHRLGLIQRNLPMSIYLIFRLTPVCLASVLFACGGTTSPGGAAPVQHADATKSAVSAFCSGYGACCASQGFAFNASLCDSNTRAEFGSADICPAPAVYDPQAAADCFAQLRGAYASCSPNSFALSACQRMCTGTLPVGATCTASTDCAPPATGVAECLPNPSGSSVCTIRTHGKVGDTCSSTCTESDRGGVVEFEACTTTSVNSTSSSGSTIASSECYTNDSLYCASDSTCKALVSIGGSCVNESTSCAAGVHCNGVTCVVDVGVGSACPSGNECADGNYCDMSSSTHVCAPKKAAGQSCTEYGECQAYCDQGRGVCVSESSSPLNVTADSCANPEPV